MASLCTHNVTLYTLRNSVHITSPTFWCDIFKQRSRTVNWTTVQFLNMLQSLFIALKLVWASWGLECTVQYSTVQYSILQYSTVHYSTIQYSTVQYSTVQYITVQYSALQYNTVLYSAVLYCNNTVYWRNDNNIYVIFHSSTCLQHLWLPEEGCGLQ